MFPKIFSENILKYDSVGYISKMLIEIYERTSQSVASKHKLTKYSFKFFDEHFRNLIYANILYFFP